MEPAKLAAFGLSLALSGGAAMSDTHSQPQDLTQPQNLVQVLLNDDRLVGYFHFDVRPGPLPLVDHSGAAIDLAGLTAQGHATVPAPDRADEALVIDTIKIGPDTAHIAFHYRREGISGAADFATAAADWTITHFTLVEN